MPVNLSDPTELRGASVTGRDDAELGRVDDVYLDNETGRAEWAAVGTGRGGGHVALVPLATADYREGTLRLPYTRSQVEDAPHHDPGTDISAVEEEQLLHHFDVPGAGGNTGSDDTGRRDTGSGDTGSGDTGSDGTMTRSEEELHVTTRRVATGRVRVRKHVVTEMRTITVPVSHEELTVEREELTGSDRDDLVVAPGLAAEEREIILYAEEPMVSTRMVAAERVRIGVRTVHEQQEVSGQVRKEELDLQQPGTPGEQP